MENLNNSALDFEYFFRFSPEMMCVLDFKGNLINANQAFEKMMGVSGEEMRAKPLIHLFHPDDRNLTVPGLHMLQSGCYENRFLCGDGTYKWFSWSVIPVNEEELVYVIVRDISRVKELENRLVQVNRQAYAIIDNISDAIFILDMEGRITYLNKTAEKLAARKKKDITGKRIWDVIPQTINTVLYKEYRKIISEKTVCDLEAFHPTRNQWFEVRVYPTEEGVTIYYHDITRHKLTEGALRLKEKAFHHSTALMAIVSYPELTIVDVNERFLNTLGFYREEVIGQPLPDLGIGADEDGRFAAVKQALQMNGMVKNREVGFKTRSGEERIGLLSIDSFVMGDKQHFLGMLNDITDDKYRQKDEGRMEQLNLAAQIASGIAHEIRNPMTTVSGLLQVLVRKEEFTRYKEYVDIIISELSRVNYIIDDCLSFGRQTSTGMKLHNLNNIIRDISSLIQAYAAEMEQEVALDLESVPDLLLDDSEIRQLLLNLVRNGLEAMSSKGKIHIHTYLEENEVVLVVRDEGGGIEPPALDKVGMPFYSTKRDGIGLGLAKCYNIAFRHNASVNIETGAGGTTFYVRFSTQLLPERYE